MRHHQYLKAIDDSEIMTYGSGNSRAGLPQLREEFWRMTIRDFEAVFFAWLNGTVSDEHALTACEEFRNVHRDTEIQDYDGDPCDRTNGETLGEEIELCFTRVFCLEDIIEEDQLQRMKRGDSIDLLRQLAYSREFLKFYREQPDPKLRVIDYDYSLFIGLSPS